MTGEYTPHHFRPLKGWNNFDYTVHIKKAPNRGQKITRLDAFTEADYLGLQKLYPYYSADNKFLVSDAITSVLTDVVLYCFKDVQPDLCISSSGGKSVLVDIADMTKLGLDPEKAIFADGCARTAVFPMNTNKAFRELYLNDADVRFSNFLLSVKEYPLHMITGIFMLECDEELRTLREQAQVQKVDRDRIKVRRKELMDELKKSPDNAQELKEELKKLEEEWSKIRKNSKLVAIRELMKRRCNVSPTSTKSRVIASTNLFWWVQMSFCGSFESGITSKRLNPNLSGNRIKGLISAALVLQKATFTHKDCIEFAKQYVNNENAFTFWDPPYVALLSSLCITYSVGKPTGFEDSSQVRYIPDLKPFGIKEINEIIMMMANAKCMSMLTHSANPDVDNICYDEGLYYLFEYESSFGTNPYVTKVWGNNIKLEGVLKHNKDGSVKSPAKVDKDEREKYKARAEWVQQYIAQLTNTTEGGEE